MNTKWALKKNPSMAFCVIAILRVSFHGTRLKLANLRGEIIISKSLPYENDVKDVNKNIWLQVLQKCHFRNLSLHSVVKFLQIE